MNRLIFRLVLALALTAGLLGGGTGAAQAAKRASPLFENINIRLLPGVLHTWTLRPSVTGDGAYIVEVTPLQHPRPMAGNYVQYAVVRPEYDGEQWNDVLSVQLPDGSEALTVNIRVYETSGLPLMSEFEMVLEPGVWHGQWLNPASETHGYAIEVTPLDPGTAGDRLDRIHVQPELPWGEWGDILRLQAQCAEPMRVMVQVYETNSLPVVMDINTVLQPADWTGFYVQPARARAGYVVEITPLDFSDGVADKIIVQPEYDGQAWNDVLRIETWPDRQPWQVNIRVYAITP